MSVDGRRTNGFMRPLHPLQVASWVVFGSDVIIFACFALPLVGTAVSQACAASCYAASVLVLVISAAKATRCDPADPNIYKREELKVQTDPELEKMPFCMNGCEVPVHVNSKHCHSCGKCVKTFDHHCMWLNNCIGENNYRAFLTVISSVVAMVGMVLGLSVYFLVEYFADDTALAVRLENSVILRDFPEELIVALLIALTCVNLPLFLLDAQLVMLHTFLSYNRMTTYDYINNKRSVLGKEKTPRTDGKTGVRSLTLPSCMDWIVFARCGRRRRRGQGGKAAAASADADAKAVVPPADGADASKAPEVEKPAAGVTESVPVVGMPVVSSNAAVAGGLVGPTTASEGGTPAAVAPPAACPASPRLESPPASSAVPTAHSPDAGELRSDTAGGSDAEMEGPCTEV